MDKTVFSFTLLGVNWGHIHNCNRAVTIVIVKSPNLIS